jgi:hypothetical protein
MFRQQAKPRGGAEKIRERRRTNYSWPTPAPRQIIAFEP